MKVGRCVVASDTAPVKEVIRHGENGWLVPFFEQRELVNVIHQQLECRDNNRDIRRMARDSVINGAGLEQAVMRWKDLALIKETINTVTEKYDAKYISKHARVRVPFVILLALTITLFIFKFYYPKAAIEPMPAKPYCDKFITKDHGMVTFETANGMKLRVPERDLGGSFFAKKSLDYNACKYTSAEFVYYFNKGALFSRSEQHVRVESVVVYVFFHDNKTRAIKSTYPLRYFNSLKMTELGLTYHPNYMISDMSEYIRNLSISKNTYYYTINNSKSKLTQKDYSLSCSVDLSKTTNKYHLTLNKFSPCIGSAAFLPASAASVHFSSSVLLNIKVLFEKLDERLSSYVVKQGGI